MTRVSEGMIAKAGDFIVLTGRVLEQRRFAFHMGTGGADGVLAALAAYRAPDGGYAFGLEPDTRGPASQPIAVPAALRLLDEIGALDVATARQLCDWLGAVTAPDGGVPAVLATLRDYPHPPWLPVVDDSPGELLATGPIVGMLLKNGIEHPWLAGAIEFCWRAVAAIQETHPYEAEAAVAFLDHAPDRDRATDQAARLGRLVRAQGLFLDPAHPDGARLAPGYAPGEFHLCCNYATTPSSLARSWFTDEEFGRCLDALAAEQEDDGGWPINWAQWAPTTASESRPVVTIGSLLVLRAYDAVNPR